MNNRLFHQDYSATVAIEDELLIGTVEIDAVIMFSAESIADLKREFEKAIDQYVTHCQEQGVEPSKPYRGTFNVRVGSENHRHLAMAARRHGISLNEVVKQAVEEFNAKYAVDADKVGQSVGTKIAMQ